MEPTAGGLSRNEFEKHKIGEHTILELVGRLLQVSGIFWKKHEMLDIDYDKFTYMATVATKNCFWVTVHENRAYSLTKETVSRKGVSFRRGKWTGCVKPDYSK